VIGEEQRHLATLYSALFHLWLSRFLATDNKLDYTEIFRFLFAAIGMSLYYGVTNSNTNANFVISTRY